MSEAVEQWIKQLCLNDDEITEFRLWWASRQGRYRGFVPRQSLVDFCQDLAKKANTERDREQDLLSNGKLSDDQYETLMLSCSALAGEVSALRAVTEWARNQVESNGSLAEDRRH
jgi:hypothetical protein